ncbi:MAG: AsmA family protein [Rhodoferax sp.]|jgi:AsmA protein|nr:AsmA family protein [Rhodoferax sp.]
MNPPSRLPRVLLWAGVVLLTPILLATLYIAVFGWNWLRSPLERLAIDKTGRVLALQGDLTVNIAWPTVRLHAAQVTFANPAWAREKNMLTAAGVAVSVDLPALLQRELVFPEVTLEKASVFLEQSADSRKSWLLDLHQQDEEARIPIGRMALAQGTLGYDDARQKTSIRAELSTPPQVATGSSAKDLRFSVVGHYKGLAIKAQGSGGPVLALRDTTQPYPVTLDASVGNTGVHLTGSITGLLTFTAVDMRMTLRGDSLEQLYPLLGIAFPATHSYVTQGHLLHAGNTWRYEQFTGRVGTSDIAGFVQVATGGKRPALSADLRSELLDLADLGPVIGARPGHTVAAAPLAQQRVLPDLPFNTGRWDSVDADVLLRAKKLRPGNALPIDKLESHLRLSDSVLTLDPLSFGLAGGQLSAKITLDGRRQPIQAHAQVRARKVLLAQLLPAFDLGKSSIGQINGEFDLTGSGNSVGRMLASASGKLGLVAAGGQISRLVMEKAGLHLWEILALNLTGDRLVKLRCAVADFDVKRGVMQAQALVFDTQVTTLTGTGRIDLAQETLDITLNPKTKNTSPVALRSPIYIRGSFAQPAISIDKGRVAARAIGAVVLGTLNPLLALIPLIDAGPGKDSDCAQLVRDARVWPRTRN